MRRKILGMALAGLVLAGGVLAFELSTNREQRPDCPGKIVCPKSGELVCRDRCPLKPEQKKVQAVPGCCQKAI